MNLARRIPLALAALVLLGAVVIQAFDPMGEIPAPKPKHLAQTIPLDLPGWVGEEVPLGRTEFLDAQVAKVLNFDDVLHLRYRRDRREISVYAAYWGAGRMPTRLVASHTPDRCWTENGWQCEQMRFDERLEAGGVKLQSADWRRFRSPDGGTTYVVFWHLIDGRAHDYGERFNKVPHPLEWWTDAVRQVVSGSREQYFVRVTSTVPFDELASDAGYRRLMTSLASLGLAEK